MMESILCRLFPYVDIKREDTGDIYLRRFFVYPRHKRFDKLQSRIYLHKFYRGDEDPHLHDHPWPFTSLILTRGYWEEVFLEESPDHPEPYFQKYKTDEEGKLRVQTWYSPLSLLRRPATWKHRVVLDDTTPVWTIVKTGKKERSWGFWVLDKLCPWRNYKNGVCWCESDGSRERIMTEQDIVFD